MAKTYYDVLHVSIDATQSEIKEQYYVLIKMFHPDRFKEGTKEWVKSNKMTRELNRAYDILYDPQKRAKYDRELQNQAEAEREQGKEEDRQGAKLNASVKPPKRRKNADGKNRPKPNASVKPPKRRKNADGKNRPKPNASVKPPKRRKNADGKNRPKRRGGGGELADKLRNFFLGSVAAPGSAEPAGALPPRGDPHEGLLHGPCPPTAIAPSPKVTSFEKLIDFLVLWDVESGEELRRFPIGGPVHSVPYIENVAFAPDGRPRSPRTPPCTRTLGYYSSGTWRPARKLAPLRGGWDDVVVQRLRSLLPRRQPRPRRVSR